MILTVFVSSEYNEYTISNYSIGAFNSHIVIVRTGKEVPRASSSCKRTFKEDLKPTPCPVVRRLTISGCIPIICRRIRKTFILNLILTSHFVFVPEDVAVLARSLYHSLFVIHVRETCQQYMPQWKEIAE
jgi:hypothetical protein